MPNQAYAVTKQKLELRIKAGTANLDEIPIIKEPLARASALLPLFDDLTAEQASLTASRQEASKRLAEVANEAQKLLTLVDVAVRQHYGNRSEKLVEFGQQPFRSKPKSRKPGPEGRPLSRKSGKVQPPEPSTNE
jgi:hypothetical protein